MLFLWIYQDCLSRPALSLYQCCLFPPELSLSTSVVSHYQSCLSLPVLSLFTSVVSFYQSCLSPPVLSSITRVVSLSLSLPVLSLSTSVVSFYQSCLSPLWLFLLQVAKTHFEENDKVKLLTLYCGDEDPSVQRAACGGLAILSSDYPKELIAKMSKVRQLCIYEQYSNSIYSYCCHYIYRLCFFINDLEILWENCINWVVQPLN